MSRATIMPPLFVCVVAVTDNPLPEFFSEAQRPDYVSDRVFAIFPAHTIYTPDFGGKQRFHHHALVTFADDLGNLFGEIAAAHKEHVLDFISNKEKHFADLSEKMADVLDNDQRHVEPISLDDLERIIAHYNRNGQNSVTL